MPDERPTSVQFHYIKSNSFRVVHTDGFIGSLTPSGYIHMASYSERPAIPQLITQRLSESGLGETESTTGRDGIVREIDIDLVMSLDVARSMRDWINERIDELERALGGAKVDG